MARPVIICDGCGVEEPGESNQNWVPISAITKLTDLATAKRWYVGRENVVNGWILHFCPDCLALHTPEVHSIVGGTTGSTPARAATMAMTPTWRSRGLPRPGSATFGTGYP